MDEPLAKHPFIPILQCLEHVGLSHVLFVFEIGDRAGEFDDPVFQRFAQSADRATAEFFGKLIDNLLKNGHYERRSNSGV